MFVFGICGHSRLCQVVSFTARLLMPQDCSLYTSLSIIWNACLPLQAALAARSRLLPLADEWAKLHDPRRNCYNEAWLAEMIDRAKDRVRAKPGLQARHYKWQQDVAACKPRYEAELAAFAEACRPWLHYITVHMSKLPYSAVSMTLQVEARSSEAIPTARLDVGHHWIVGDAAALAILNEVHLPTAVMHTASVQGTCMPQH